MKKVLVLTFVAMFAFVGLASAKVAVVDYEKVLKNSKKGKDILTQIKGQEQKYRKELDNKRADLQRMEESIKKQSKILSDEARAKKIRDLNKQVVDFRSMAQEYDRAIKRLRNDLLSDFGKSLSSLIESLGKELKYDLIVDKLQGGVIYASDKVDLTKIVIERLNKGWKK